MFCAPSHLVAVRSGDVVRVPAIVEYLWTNFSQPGIIPRQFVIVFRDGEIPIWRMKYPKTIVVFADAVQSVSEVTTHFSTHAPDYRNIHYDRNARGNATNRTERRRQQAIACLRTTQVYRVFLSLHVRVVALSIS